MAQDAHHSIPLIRLPRLLGAFLCLALGPLGRADAVGSRGEGLPAVQTVGRSQGLTSSYPTSVLSDLEGRLWVATDGGALLVGDGLRFLPVDLPLPLQKMAIHQLACDALGRIWLLSTGGLGVWDRGHWRVYESIRLNKDTKTYPFCGFAKAPTGELWVVASGRAYHLPGQGTPEVLPLPGEDSAGELGLAWVGNHLVTHRLGQVWRLDGKVWTPLPSLAFEPSERADGPMRADAAGHLYMSTDQHLYHLAPGATTWAALSTRPPGTRSLLSSLRDGQVWLLQNGFVQRWFQGRCTETQLPADLTLIGRIAACLDEEGNLWLTGSDLQRISVLDLVRRHVGPDHPPARWISQILQDRLGAIWVRATDVVYRRNDSGWLKVASLPPTQWMDQARDGSMYVQSQGRLLRVDPGTLRAEAVPIPLLGQEARIAQGPVTQGDRLWILDTDGQLLLGQRKARTWTWTREPLPALRGLASRLRKDERGRPWISHGSHFFWRLEEHWEELPMPIGTGPIVGLSSVAAHEALAAQSRPPALWTLTREASGWIVHARLSAEALNGVGSLSAVRQDRHGVVWLNTERGLVRVSADTPPRLLCFGNPAGLPTDEANQDALHLDASERLWIGTQRGLAELRPTEGEAPLTLRVLSTLRAPTILEARCGDWASQAAEPRLQVQQGQGSVVFELGFPGPVRGGGAHFEFREAGGSWLRLSGAALQFPEISSGNHIYEVRMISVLGEPGPSTRLEIEVRPPWYRHPLVYGVYALLLAGAAVLGLRWQQAARRRWEQKVREAVESATTNQPGNGP